MSKPLDAVVVGAGPNGLAAAITLARAGRSVLVLEAHDREGGGARTEELTLPGYLHDVCSAIHPFAVSSPFMRHAPLQRFGLDWIHPEIPLVHPFDDGSAAVMHRSLGATASGLGQDGDAYERLLRPFVQRWDDLAPAVLGPIVRTPRHPLLLARFGLAAVRSAESLADRFEGSRARALLLGIAAHSMVPLNKPLTGAFGLALAVAGHASGWPLARGGSESIASAMAGLLRALGGEIQTGRAVRSAADLPPSHVVLFDTAPQTLVRIAGSRMSASARAKLARFKPGPAVFKLDYALSEPIPWTSSEARRAGTVHLAGEPEEVLASEEALSQGRMVDRPFVLVAQQSLFDASRAPAGKQAAWAYCHVPNGCQLDLTARIEDQIERFAPGFRDIVLARHAIRPSDLEQYNENNRGGDITGGSSEMLQLFFRPTVSLHPYRTAVPRWYLCSASTPPGPGVHGMAGYWAARAALSDWR